MFSSAKLFLVATSFIMPSCILVFMTLPVMLADTLNQCGYLGKFLRRASSPKPAALLEFK
jgi:hypothetical protein